MRLTRLCCLLTAVCAGLFLAATPALANDMTWFQSGTNPNFASYDDSTNTFYVADNRADGHAAALQVRRPNINGYNLCITPSHGTKSCSFGLPENVAAQGRLCLYDSDQGYHACTAFKNLTT